MEIHEGKTFSCEICARSFTRVAYLRKHQLMHGDQDKYAEVKSKRAANCRRQRSGMTDAQKEEYKKDRREYMRDWLAKKRKTTVKLLNPVIPTAFPVPPPPASMAPPKVPLASPPLPAPSLPSPAVSLALPRESLATVRPMLWDGKAADTKVNTAAPQQATAAPHEVWSSASAPVITIPFLPQAAESAVAEIPTTIPPSVQLDGQVVPLAPTSSAMFIPAAAVTTTQTAPTIFTPATTMISTPIMTTTTASATAATPSPNGIMPISSLMRTIATPACIASSSSPSGLATASTHEAIFIDPTTVATLVESAGCTVEVDGTSGNGLTIQSQNELKPLTFALPSNVIEAPSLNATGVANEMKQLTLALPSNIAVSLGLTNGLQPANLNQIQIPANVLPVALANGTIANIPISMTNAIFPNTTLSSSLPPL